VISVGKAAWNKVEPYLRVVLAREDVKGMPKEVFFTVRAGNNEHYTPVHSDLEDLIVKALEEKYGPGVRGDWWPRWWVWPEEDYLNWSRYEVLLELRKKETENQALQYFINRLAGMAKTVESILDDWLLRHSLGGG
jgi:hypothetical protein